jgi:hypothetical protein
MAILTTNYCLLGSATFVNRLRAHLFIELKLNGYVEVPT